MKNFFFAYIGATAIHLGDQAVYRFIEKLMCFVDVKSTEPCIRSMPARAPAEDRDMKPTNREQRVAMTKGAKYTWNALPIRQSPSVSRLEDHCERRNKKLEYFCKTLGKVHAPRWEVVVRGTPLCLFWFSATSGPKTLLIAFVVDGIDRGDMTSEDKGEAREAAAKEALGALAVF